MRTKKAILLSAIFALSMMSSVAYSQIKFGVKTGVDLNGAAPKNDVFDVKNLTSYHAGLGLEIMFPFSFVEIGAEASLMYNDNRMTINNLKSENPKTTITNRYLTLPVNAKVKVPLGSETIKLYANAGPYVGYRVWGDKIDIDQMNKDIEAKRFQAGANIGLGVELFEMIQIGANYKVRLTDNYSINEPNWEKPLNGNGQTWSITAAVYF